MRKYFATGLAILLPIVLTCVIAAFILRMLTKPFLNLTEQIFFLFAGHDHIIATHPAALHLFAQILIALLLFGLIVFIGFIGQLFLAKVFFAFGDKIIHNIPFVNKIYKATQDVIQNFVNPHTSSFSQVVLVPFPNKNSHSLGFITREGLPAITSCAESKLVSVFVPGTPNPTMGFMLLFEKEQLIPIDLRVDEALKFIVSCGVICEKRHNHVEIPCSLP